MRFGPGPGPTVLRDPQFDLADILPPYESPEDVGPLPARALVTGTEFPPVWPVWDQGELQSCTAHAAAAMLMHLQLLEAGGGAFRAPAKDDPDVSPSRDFLWYESQRAMREFGVDAGVWVRVAVGSLRRFGGCSDALWRSLPEHLQDYGTWAQDLQAKLDELGVLDRAAEALPLRALHLGSDAYDPSAAAGSGSVASRDIEPMKRCLQEGHPFVMALVWYDRFEPPAKSLPDGDFPLPAPGSSTTGAGHTVTVVGYDDAFTSPDGDQRGARWLVRNSQGADSGHAGYVSLPYAWATNPNYSHGLWTIRRGRESTEDDQ